MTTAKDVAQWMRDEVTKVEILYQQTAAREIEDRFGEEFIYINDNRNPAISKEVLQEFRTLTEDIVVWERVSRRWRLRDERDTPGRRQSE